MQEPPAAIPDRHDLDRNETTSAMPRSLRLLSFNIHAATSAAGFHHYLMHSWRQVLPHAQRVHNLDEIAALVAEYDMVGLQEVDSGSLRSGYVNQSRYIAAHAGMPYWFHQANRKVGTMAYAGNGFLARYQPRAVEEHRLPGAIPGRGSLVMRFGGDNGLVVAVVHLALGPRARGQQLEYMSRQLEGEPRLIVMGDLNTRAGTTAVRAFREVLDLEAPTAGLASYPSWQPQRAIDHILVSRGLKTRDERVIETTVSDHCPVALTVEIPAEVELEPAPRALAAG